jgi:hypothetical protein
MNLRGAEHDAAIGRMTWRCLVAGVDEGDTAPRCCCALAGSALPTPLVRRNINSGQSRLNLQTRCGQWRMQHRPVVQRLSRHRYAEVPRMASYGSVPRNSSCSQSTSLTTSGLRLR